jgi:uncharacterized protein YecT (DUF1311 family)
LLVGLAIFVGGFLSACSGGTAKSAAPSDEGTSVTSVLGGPLPLIEERATSSAASRVVRLAPPVIRESINPLPCPRSRAARQTTLGARACLNKVILRTDAAINARTKAIFRLLRDRTGKIRFLAAERAWLSYRTASCRSDADVYRGGSAQPILFADCVVRRNRTHLKDLASVNDFLRRIH